MKNTGIKFVKLLLLICCFSFPAAASLVIGSWNLENFGAKKGEQTIEIMAESLRAMDIIAVQEVLASKGGAVAVAKLADALNRKGYKWSYVISEVTTSDNAQERERYAFLWKSSKVKLIGKAALAMQFEAEICREPFLARFECEGKQFTLVNFHALPKKKLPEAEIKYLRDFKRVYPKDNLIFLGDFNCPQSNTVFNLLKEVRYQPALVDQKTTLRQECKQNECLASEYDNIFYPVKMFTREKSGIVPFHLKFFGGDMHGARKVSDHLPIFVSFK